jgi:hypothetical protein
MRAEDKGVKDTIKYFRYCFGCTPMNSRASWAGARRCIIWSPRVLYSLDESLDRSGIASDFDDLGFFDFVEM